MSLSVKVLLLAVAVLTIPIAWAIGNPVDRATAAAQATPLPMVTPTLPAVATSTPELATATLPPATATLVPATATAPAGGTPTIVPTVVTLTLGPTVTPGAAAPDLTITVLEAPDVVPPGAPIGYILTVANHGTAASPVTTVLNQLPGGTAPEAIGPGCVPAGNGISCAVPSLAPGTGISFTFSISAEAGPGVVVNTALVDPANAVVEANEANNSATASTTVALLPGPPPPLPPVAFPPPAPQPPVAEQPIPPAPAPAAPASPPAAVVPPIDVAGVQVIPPQAATGEMWLQILAPTQAYSVEMDPLWVATPGEWYIVTQTDGGWALAVWEGDTTGWSVWIEMDQRVSATMVDRADPRIAGDIWLLSHEPTEAYSASTMRLAWMTSPGEWYRVLQTDGSWALAVYETDPLSASVWIPVDARVELTPGDAPHSPA
jgi:hypothetical protein